MASSTLAAILLVSAPAFSDPWLTFGMTPGYPKERVAIEVRTVLRTSAQVAANPNDVLTYWAKMTIRLSDLKATYWTDTRHCPQLKKVVASVTELKLPTIWTPESWSEVTIHTDAARYELTATTTYGERFGEELHFEAQPETPLAAWFEESYRSLHPCWSGKRPI
jgi:hypothetical protein